jgi:hypothetical protein
MSLVSSIEVPGSDPSFERDFRVVDRFGCRIVYGSIPMRDMGRLFEHMDEGAVIDITASNRLGAHLVVGLPQDIEILLANTPLRTLEEPWLSQVGEGAAAWVATGAVGTSSNWMLHCMTGFNALGWLHHRGPASTPDLGHPRDIGDFARCRRLLEAQPNLQERLGTVAQSDPTWALFIDHWSEICASMDMEVPGWREQTGFEARATNALIALVLQAEEAHKSPRP